MAKHKFETIEDLRNAPEIMGDLLDLLDHVRHDEHAEHDHHARQRGVDPEDDGRSPQRRAVVNRVDDGIESKRQEHGDLRRPGS